MWTRTRVFWLQVQSLIHWTTTVPLLGFMGEALRRSSPMKLLQHVSPSDDHPCESNHPPLEKLVFSREEACSFSVWKKIVLRLEIATLMFYDLNLRQVVPCLLQFRIIFILFFYAIWTFLEPEYIEYYSWFSYIIFETLWLFLYLKKTVLEITVFSAVYLLRCILCRAFYF